MFFGDAIIITCEFTDKFKQKKKDRNGCNVFAFRVLESCKCGPQKSDSLNVIPSVRVIPVVHVERKV